MSGEQPAHRSPAGSSSASLLIVGGVVLVLGLFGAGVALAFAGWQVASIVGLLGGLGTVAGVLLGALSKLGTLTDRVEQVAHQTNGALREFVSSEVGTQVRSALTDHGLPPRTPPPPIRAERRARREHGKAA